MTIKIGDNVTLKSGGTEVYGRVIQIIGGTATIKVWDSVCGEFYNIFETLSRCSKDY